MKKRNIETVPIIDETDNIGVEEITADIAEPTDETLQANDADITKPTDETLQANDADITEPTDETLQVNDADMGAYFRAYPDVDEFYVTTDGQVFLKRNYADLHQRGLKGSLQIIKRV